MSVKIKGNQWCDRCQRPVAAVKSTHRLRNIGAVVMAPFTVGLSVFAASNDAYACSACGGPVRAISKPAVSAKKRESDQLKGALLIALIVVAIIVQVLRHIS